LKASEKEAREEVL